MVNRRVGKAARFIAHARKTRAQHGHGATRQPKAVNHDNHVMFCMFQIMFRCLRPFRANSGIGLRILNITLAHLTGLDKHNYITNYIAMNKNYLRAIPREWRNLSKVFTALGDEHRQRILLTFSPGERLNVGQIVEVSTLSRSAVSHHLRLLRDAGILHSRKEGKEVFFWIDKNFLIDAFETVAGFIRDNA